MTPDQNDKAIAEGSPPSYDESASYLKQRRPGPATAGEWYANDPQEKTMHFEYSPDPSKAFFIQDWVGMLKVKCFNVPALMVDGFFWGSANVIDEDGYYGISSIRREGKKPWVLSRYYFLKDLQEPPRWTAKLEITAVDFGIVQNFDLDRLSWKNVYYADAWTASGKPIYRFLHHQRDVQLGVRLSAVHQGPMEGHWPWPRRNVKNKEEDGEVPKIRRKWRHFLSE